jgi:predicted nucleotidyltransferase
VTTSRDENRRAEVSPTGDSEPELDKQIVNAVEGVPGIAALAVFGSRASGRERPDSDLDVAVLPAKDADRRDLQVSVAVALSDLAPEGRVDVVLLDEAPELLRHNVLAGSRLILCRDERAWRDLRVWTMREHGDRVDYEEHLARFFGR